MAFALLFVGVLMTVAAVRGTHADLAKLVKGDFTGPGNFLYWTAAVILVGVIGYIPPLRKISMAFLAVILLGLFFAKKNATAGGFFAQLQSALNATTTASARDAVSGGQPSAAGTQTAPAQSGVNGLPSLPSLPSWSELEGILAGSN